MEISQSCFVGVIGANGSGKSSFCDYLIQNGFYAISLSDVVRQDLKENGRSVDRDSLTQRANELKTQHGLSYFAETCFSQVMELGHQKVVFDSIRHPLEAAFLKEKGVHLIGVTVSQLQRFERIKSRKRETDFVDFETFKQQDERERSGKSVGQSIDDCFNYCDDILENNGTLDAFKKSIDDKILRSLLA